MKYKFIFLSFLLPKILCCQEIMLRTTVGSTLPDTVRFGFNSTATMGVDVSLGELDRFGEPIEDTTLLILQRDSFNFNCAYHYFTASPGERKSERVLFEEVFDSKVNLRPGPVNASNRFFEITIRGDEVQRDGLVLRSLSNKSLGELIDVIHTQYGECGLQPNSASLYESQPLDVIYIAGASPETGKPLRSLLLGFRMPSVSSEETAADLSRNAIAVHPNPARDHIYLSSKNMADLMPISIFDMMGGVVWHGVAYSRKIDVSALPQGTYTIVEQGVTSNKIGRFSILRN